MNAYDMINGMVKQSGDFQMANVADWLKNNPSEYKKNIQVAKVMFGDNPSQKQIELCAICSPAFAEYNMMSHFLKKSAESSSKTNGNVSRKEEDFRRIRQEIGQTVRELCKQAQIWGYYAPAHNIYDPYTNLGNVHLLRGIARGAKEAIPSVVDTVVGSPSGAIYGLGTGLRSKWRGGSFSDGFWDGFGSETELVKKEFSDPIRRLEMELGGNAAKKMFNGAQKNYEGAIERNIGSDAEKRNEFVRNKALYDALEDGVSAATTTGLTLPVYGKILGGLVGGMSRAKSAVPLSRVPAASSGSKWTGAARKMFNGAVNGANSLYAPYEGIRTARISLDERMDAEIMKLIEERKRIEYEKRNRVGPTIENAERMSVGY